jgi:hypothetical protein
MSIKALNRAFHRHQLTAWMAEYQLDRQLREPVPQASGASSCSHTRNPACPAPAPGQIRLLSPTTVSLSAIERPVYVLLMPTGSADTLALIPFSRYRIPATPREWRTRFNQPPLRVLCLWNQHVCDRADFHAGWFIKTITQKQQAEVARVLPMLNDLQAYASRRFGPPLQHPLDPRHVYLQEEGMLLSDLCMRSDETVPTTLQYRVSETYASYRRAAEPRADYLGSSQFPDRL